MIDLLQTHDLTCPYCGEDIQMVIDCSVASQEYIEDCQVCCRPINLVINIDDEIIDIRVSHENE
ncbi:MAG: CPXCG motif-containing cysteine-rich protein [Gammaproteobacteria bacterium]|nr:CPXCG motif-containing cysteine-rich protein [Gammaproteobacteria bacterium]